MIEWASRYQYPEYVKFTGKPSATFSAGLVEKLNLTNERVNIGFSEDRETLYIKLDSNKGGKLSIRNEHSNGRTFSTLSIFKQFGDSIIGMYAFDSYDAEKQVITLHKL